MVLMTFTPVQPDKTRVWGCDISFWQDQDETPQKVDFRKMKAGGASFVFIRAGQNKWRDPDFADFWGAAKGIIPRGAYFYLDSRASMKDQARVLADALFMDPGELPYAIDFEQVASKKAGINTQLTISHFNDFYGWMQEFLPMYKKQPICYTGYYFWRDFGSSNALYSHFPLWIARYKAAEPLVPAPWTKASFWQWTDGGPGKELGVESNAIDLNYFMGTREEFDKLSDNGGVPQPAVSDRNAILDEAIKAIERLKDFDK